MSIYERFVANIKLRRLIVLLSLVLVLWLSRSAMNIILLTFIFSFLVTRAINFFRRFGHVKAWLIVAPIYILIVIGLLYVIIHYVPSIAKQSVHLYDLVLKFYNSDEFKNSATIQWVLNLVDETNLKTQLQSGITTILEYAGSITAMGVTVLLSLILSFFFTVGIDELKDFGQTFLVSPFGWFFADLKFFADKFINTFGVVIEAQIFIAIVNTVITTITLIFLKMPSIPGLAAMVFLLSMIPVAGAIISVIPLSIVAYTVDGFRGIATIVVMIILIHALEAYVLNPKFMSSRTKLPVFFTFVVLLVGERLFGTWGLIIGIPVFTFLLDIIGVKKIEAPTPATTSGTANPSDTTSDPSK
ncbi:AI-2E family transporter [Lapidilactobacillus gannanensis]|uniref:AI-2E family transporter n=1 Tax=Lapidilactobacillus gannanensis TaxID=2486002 RepID=A0ABW4BQ45_9LACO|nr:AI-2E family transporter [Lapidilactobacillus gannanensis]